MSANSQYVKETSSSRGCAKKATGGKDLCLPLPTPDAGSGVHGLVKLTDMVDFGLGSYSSNAKEARKGSLECDQAYTRASSGEDGNICKHYTGNYRGTQALLRVPG